MQNNDLLAGLGLARLIATVTVKITATNKKSAFRATAI
jgi:hypothetical protein